MHLIRERKQHIEHRHHRIQARLDVWPEPVLKMLKVAHDGHYRQGGFDTHVLIPGAFSAQFAVLGNALDTAKVIVNQDNVVSIHALDEGMRPPVRKIHGGPIPGDDLSLVIEQPVQFDTDTP